MYARVYYIIIFIKIVTRTNLVMGCCQNIYNSPLTLSILTKAVLPQFILCSCKPPHWKMIVLLSNYISR
jgi:hypothetical protein